MCILSRTAQMMPMTTIDMSITLSDSQMECCWLKRNSIPSYEFRKHAHLHQLHKE